MNTLPDLMMMQHIMPLLDYEECGRFACVSKQAKSIAMEDYGWSTRHTALTRRHAEETRDFSAFEIVPESVHWFQDSFWNCGVDSCTDLSHYERRTLKLTKPFRYEPDLRAKSIILMYDFLWSSLPVRASVVIALRDLKKVEDRLAILQNMPVLQEKRIKNTKAKINECKDWVGRARKRSRFEDDFAHVLPEAKRVTK